MKPNSKFPERRRLEKDSDGNLRGLGSFTASEYPIVFMITKTSSDIEASGAKFSIEFTPVAENTYLAQRSTPHPAYKSDALRYLIFAIRQFQATGNSSYIGIRHTMSEFMNGKNEFKLPTANLESTSIGMDPYITYFLEQAKIPIQASSTELTLNENQIANIIRHLDEVIAKNIKSVANKNVRKPL